VGARLKKRRDGRWLDAALAPLEVVLGGPGARGAGECEMKTLVEMIVKALVDQPDAVRITEIKGNHAHVIELSVAKEDLGKVIGKGGAHASAIRTLLAAASGKENRRYILEIIEH
jgi:predicted RNA-binding protein YlqC (UPF0109 family)